MRTRGNCPSFRRAELTQGVGSLWRVERLEEDGYPVDLLLTNREPDFISLVRPEIRKTGFQAR